MNNENNKLISGVSNSRKVVMMTKYLDTKTGEEVECSPIKVRFSNSGESVSITDQNFFIKLYKDKMLDIGKAIREANKSYDLLMMLVIASESYRYQTISVSESVMADILGGTEKRLRDVIKV